MLPGKPGARFRKAAALHPPHTLTPDASPERFDIQHAAARADHADSRAAAPD
jgi:hypothetical protein